MGVPGPSVVAAPAGDERALRSRLLVIAEFVLGKANKEIAATLGCAEVTVEYHLTAIRRKMGLDGRAALIARFWIDAHDGG